MGTHVAAMRHVLKHKLTLCALTPFRCSPLVLPGDDAELVLHVASRPAEVDIFVESVPAAVRALTATGAELIAGPFEIRIGLCAVLHDPWKNPIVIFDSSKELLKVDDNKWVQPKNA